MYSVSQDALSLLAENAELSNQDGRGVAFRRAAAVLKALPEAVTSMKQLKGLPCLGGHSQRVIKVSELSFVFFMQKKTKKHVVFLRTCRTSWRMEHQTKCNL